MKNNDLIPKEFMQNLKPMPVDVLHEDVPEYIFMTGEQLEAERQAIAEALQWAHGPFAMAEAPMQAEAYEMAECFARLLNHDEPPGADVLRDALKGMPEHLQGLRTLALNRRLSQIRVALHHAQRYRGEDFDPTSAFAVSPQWQRRWEALIGGQLLPAYVAFLPIDGFR